MWVNSVILEKCFWCESLKDEEHWTPQMEQLHREHLEFEHGMIP
jgi:hypothetical protein